MKNILQINGREQSFSEEELIARLEELEELKNKETETTKQIIGEVDKNPTEGEWFEVNPNFIEQSLFSKSREDSNQETTRKLILEAFEEVKNNPSKYSKGFKTMMLEKTWELKTVGELKKIVKEKGYHIADWVEQALEWAQRLQNGESWEDICNKADIAKWFRLVVWKNGCIRLIGGSHENYTEISATYINYGYYHDKYRLTEAVPLVVSY
ncbi:MAG: hypothetical protein K2H53_02070 [Clostridia bacterium]|nr:hypothetical protein [Clostridia bacterium]